MRVLLGVDPHKTSVAIAAVDEATGELLERAGFPQDHASLRSLERWARRSPSAVGRWRTPEASVGTWRRGWRARASRWWTCRPSFRRGCGCSRLATRARTTGSTPSPPRWPPRARSGWRPWITGPPRRCYASLSERREDLVAERTRALKAASTVFYETSSLAGWPGNAFGPPCRTRPAQHTSPGRPVSRPAPTGFGGAALRVRTLDRKIADLNERIEAEVEASGTTLTQIFGVGPILAARIIGTVGDVGRFPTKAHFASYSGTAPLEASSGEKVRHRLSLAGNRKLNYCLHMVATSQARSDVRGGTYCRKKIAEGKSRKEARLRCRLQVPSGGFAGTLKRRRLTKRSRESPKGEVRRIYLPRR